MGQRPINTLRDGKLSISIWRNEKAEGDGFWYEAKPGRTYTDKDDKAQTAITFSGADLLVMAELYRRSYHWIRQQEARDREQAREVAQAA